jgi:hypothetical protein
MPLGDAAKAAHAAFWAAKHGRVLAKDLVQDKLLAYFAGRGEALVDLPTDVDTDDSTSWQSEWETIAKSAGITDEVDIGRLVQWLRKRAAGPSAGKAVGAAGRALETLETHGITLSAAVVSDLEKTLSSGEAGDIVAQSTSCLCVALIYVGKPFEPDDAERWQRLHSGLSPTSAAMGGGQIDICQFESYILLQKRSNHLTLERALKTKAGWEEKFDSTLNLLQSHGLTGAVTMWHMVARQAVQQARDNEKKQRAYLYQYFFHEYLGLGMPTVLGIRSAVNTLAPGSSDSLGDVPTTSTPYDLALSGLQSSSRGANSFFMGDMGSEIDTGSMAGSGRSSTPSSASAMLDDAFAAKVAQAILAQGGGGQAGVQPPPPPSGLPPGLQPKAKCQFCKADCGYSCAASRTAFSDYRRVQNEKERVAAAKRRSDLAQAPVAEE